MNQYLMMKKQLSNQIKKYPFFIAESSKSYEKGIKKLGYTMDQQDKVQYVGEFCHVRKSDVNSLVSIILPFYGEVCRRLKEDKDFAKDFFLYVLIRIMDTLEDPTEISFVMIREALAYEDISALEIAVGDRIPEATISGYMEAQDVIYHMINEKGEEHGH